jgi:tRNA pseudouridine13 synthase
MAIKKVPSDFQVEEIIDNALLESRSETGGFALYRLEKESLATPDAVGLAARKLNLRSGAFAYAGLKDKHARTSQYVSLNLTEIPDVPGEVKDQNWQLEPLGRISRAVTASDIQRNRFRITLRNLTADEVSDMDQAAKLLAGDDGQLRVINYFGDQRFGSARHGKGFLARNLIKGDFEGALKLAIATEARKDRMDQKIFKRTVRENWGKWHELLPKLKKCAERRAIERLVNSGKDYRAAFCALPYLFQQLTVYAYQSYLWNAIARKLVEKECAPRGQVLYVEDTFGAMLFPTRESLPPELLALELPLLAKKTELIEPWKQSAEEVLAAEGIAVSDIQIPGVRRPFFGEEPRALFFTTQDFELAPALKDETAGDKSRMKRTVTFSLPPGSYATVLLRALGQ